MNQFHIPLIQFPIRHPDGTICGYKRACFPLIQGGMGVGVSLGTLAGNVAKCGGIGVISSVHIGYREADFATEQKEANLRALAAEIQKAKAIADGKGLIGVNIMTAVNGYDDACRTAVAAGADMIISGAGLPLNLPEFTRGTQTLCAPIVSSARAAKLLIRHYQKNYGVLPDFFVMEGHLAGGHLGFRKEELADGTARDNDTILAEILAELQARKLEIPVFTAGGVFTGADMAHAMKRGAAGVQIGTRFIATEECDAHHVFKETIVNAKEEDIRLIASPVGMPARAIWTPLLQRLQEGEKFGPKPCTNCLKACPKNDTIPYCISRALTEAVKGNYEDGLFFTGANAHRIDRIMPVAELMDEIRSEFEIAMRNSIL